jgi:hypothetical protein
MLKEAHMCLANMHTLINVYMLVHSARANTTRRTRHTSVPRLGSVYVVRKRCLQTHVCLEIDKPLRILQRSIGMNKLCAYRCTVSLAS